MFLSFLFFAFLAYLVFKLVTGFVIPIYRTTKQVRKTFREMSEQMNGSPTAGRQSQASAKPQASDKKTGLGDYIDFEEVKD